ncbi:MAG: DNA topoisomerase IB [Planctomycetes bacterium]|nr:DNA topoisomerase IB [Planctomycetota bacterium]
MARRAALRYVSDQEPGIQRQAAGKGFRYRSPTGRAVRNAALLRRIRALVIPPAWTDVWICPSPHGHLQATGRDARRRKQYLYHPKWSEIRDEAKYGRMAMFGKLLPRIRRRVTRDMALPGLPKEKVLATLVRLLEATMIRVGNEEYAKANSSFGLTTLRDRHAAIQGTKLQFRFRGKSGKDHTVEINSPRLARTVKRCQDLPGQELFQYLDEAGERHSIGSADVNAYLREISGEDITAKDFRTWAGTCLAADLLCHQTPPQTKTEAKRVVNEMIRAVAKRLGNTVAICRKCYIHPAVLENYENGVSPSNERKHVNGKARRHPGVRQPERIVLALLKKRSKS